MHTMAFLWSFSIMGIERADHKSVPEEEVLKRETWDTKAVGISENKTMAMSNPAQPYGKLLTYGYTGHAVTSRNRYMITVPGLYESTPDPDHSTAFVLNTAFREPYICKYWHGRDKALFNPKWIESYHFVSFGKARLKFSRLLPSTTWLWVLAKTAILMNCNPSKILVPIRLSAAKEEFIFHGHAGSKDSRSLRWSSSWI